jgi:hypothetical protein
MSKDEYKTFINTHMNELDIPYITAKQYICLQQINQEHAGACAEQG